jgi:uncharacterized membrane protein YhhN
VPAHSDVTAGLSGLRHPVKLLPLLLFESAWKLLWLVLVAPPRATTGALDGATTETTMSPFRAPLRRSAGEGPALPRCRGLGYASIDRDVLQVQADDQVVGGQRDRVDALSDTSFRPRLQPAAVPRHAAVRSCARRERLLRIDGRSGAGGASRTATVRGSSGAYTAPTTSSSYIRGQLPLNQRSVKLVRRSTVLFVAAAATDVLLASTGRERLRRVTKPLLMPTLMPGRDAATRSALALGWAGDVALLGASDAAFTAGLGSFLACHLAWIAALRQRDSSGQLRNRLPWAVLEVAACGALNGYLWHRTGKHRIPVIVYSCALLAMSLVSLDSRSRKVAAGGALFLASDALVALQKFSDLKVPQGQAAVMSTYAAAQALLSG